MLHEEPKHPRSWQKSMALFACTCAYLTHAMQIQCIDPTDLRQRLESNNPTINITQFMSEFNEDSCPDVVQSELDIAQRCSNTDQHHHSNHLRYRSTCPWVTEVTCDINRYPIDLHNARCCHRHHCNGRSHNHNCESITIMVTVLMRSGRCVGGFHEYVERQEQISVGCTCAARRRRHRHG